MVLGDTAPSPRPAWVPASRARRCDPLTLLACAAVDRLMEGLIDAHQPLHADAALVVGTAYGSVTSTLRFCDDQQAFGDGGGSPSAFTASVHNATAGTIGEWLGLHGPTSTISHGALSALAALRWGMLLLASGRAPEVLVIAADHHCPFTTQVIGDVTHHQWPIQGGAVALRLSTTGLGREIRLGEFPAPLAIDAGAPHAADERWLASSAHAHHQQRSTAPVVCGGWWPTAALAAAPWTDARALQFRAIDHAERMSLWLGPLGLGPLGLGPLELGPLDIGQSHAS